MKRILVLLSLAAAHEPESSVKPAESDELDEADDPDDPDRSGHGGGGDDES